MTVTDLAGLAADANERLEDASATEILRWGYGTFGDRLAVTSSMADTVLLHLASTVRPGADVIFLDTGYHFVETIGTRDAAATYAVNLITVEPQQTVAEQDAAWGKDLFASDPDQCCGLRKVKPLNRALSGYEAWATGVRRADSPVRALTPIVQYDPKRKMIKLAPLATWSDEDVENYIAEHQLIINPLLEDGYPSIGCAPCTSRASSDDARAGRWAGSGKTECGIHL